MRILVILLAVLAFSGCANTVEAEYAENVLTSKSKYGKRYLKLEINIPKNSVVNLNTKVDFASYDKFKLVSGIENKLDIKTNSCSLFIGNHYKDSMSYFFSDGIMTSSEIKVKDKTELQHKAEFSNAVYYCKESVKYVTVFNGETIIKEMAHIEVGQYASIKSIF